MRSRKLLSALGLLVLAVATSYLIWVTFSAATSQGLGANDVAGIIAAAIAIPAAATALLRLFHANPSRLSLSDLRAAQEQVILSAKVDWSREAALLGLDRSIPVKWEMKATIRYPSTVERDDQVELRIAEQPDSRGEATVFGGRSDQVEEMVRSFRQLIRRRVVVLGESGSGKTTLAIAMMLELIDSRDGEEPVPLFLSAASWNFERHERLHDWIGAELRDQFPGLRTFKPGADVASELARQSMVLPVIDGLDELPSDARAGFVRALDLSLTPSDQFIITCRAEEYAEVVRSTGILLPRAVAVLPEPLIPADVVRHLEIFSARHSRPAGLARVEQAVQESPDSPVGKALTVALNLWLLTIYRGDPADLLDESRYPTASAIRAALLEQLVTALLARDSERNEPRAKKQYDPVKAEHWLKSLARLTHQAETRDIAWWQLARYSLTDWSVWAPLAVALAGAVALVPPFGYDSTSWITGGLTAVFSGSPVGGVIGGSAVGIGGGVALWLSFADQSSRWLGSVSGNNVESSIRWLLRRRVGGLFLGSFFGAFCGVVIGLIEGISAGLTFGLSSGVTFGLASGLTFGIAGNVTSHLAVESREAPAASTPLSTLRSDISLALVASGVVLVALTAAFGLVVGFAFAFAHLLMGAIAGKTSQASIVYLIAVVVLYLRGKSPLRLMRFLSDCRLVGILHSTGPSYRFMHAALHDNLALRR